MERAEQFFRSKRICFCLGAVRSVKETLNSQFVENCKGVIQRLTLQEHKMVWNRTTHLWYIAFLLWPGLPVGLLKRGCPGCCFHVFRFS